VSEALDIWTVYDHPSDMPDKFVARRFVVDATGPRATKDVLASPDLAALREGLEMLGLTPLARSPEDDPKIVESWL